MSPQLHHFGSAAQGQIPQQGASCHAVILGRPSSEVDLIAEQIGHGVAIGHVDTIQIAVSAHAAHVVTATPGGGLHATGKEDVRYQPAPDNEMLFTRPHNDMGIKPGMA